jgi:hypothetical protein
MTILPPLLLLLLLLLVLLLLAPPSNRPSDNGSILGHCFCAMFPPIRAMCAGLFDGPFGLAPIFIFAEGVLGS